MSPIMVVFVLLSGGLAPVLGMPGAKDKQPLTEKQVRSGKFRYLQQITGLDSLGLHVLYQTSGTRKFDDFAFALTVAHLLRLNRQIVVGALHERKLKDVLKEMAVPEDQAKGATKMAKKLLKEAEKGNWIGIH